MYIKDSKSIRWFWAVKLAILRITVYAILCFVFLLPAVQTKERTEKRSRVVVVLDISPSMTRVSDEIDSRGRKAKTRMDVLIDFLTDDNVKLIAKILERNPVVVYPFGSRLDETAQVINRDEKPWNKSEWEAFAAYDFRPFMLKGLSEAGKDTLQRTSIPVEWNGPKLPTDLKKLEPANWADWAAVWQGYAKQNEGGNEDDRKPLVNGMSKEDDKILRENITKMDRRIEVARSIALGTNVPDSLTAAVNREAAEHGARHHRLLGRPEQPRVRLFVPRAPRPGDQGEDPGLHRRGRRGAARSRVSQSPIFRPTKARSRIRGSRSWSKWTA